MSQSGGYFMTCKACIYRAGKCVRCHGREREH